MAEANRCSQCGVGLPSRDRHGLCPKCLLAAAFELPQAAEPMQESAAKRSAEQDSHERIGRYKLLQQIGEGGCGVVYMAEQEEPVRRRVALKVIKLGMDTREIIARFEAERQALALMDHVNIAKVLDAGATETGRPFFVMELVRGVPIIRYCDENRLNTHQRLELFVQVCQAIQHAHQKGIIHRDIKPANIVVADHDGVAVPKVIDFGIAKAIAGQPLTDKTVFTAFEQFIGTPAYMSPEQAKLSGLDIDTRSDIYSLGVLLYELLTGKTPFDAKRLVQAGLDEVRRIIREEEPPRPSTRLSTMDGAEQTTVARQRDSEPPKLLTALRGDLDWIIMKSLDKDRNRRYETANGLAMDVQRHLNNEPVVARPPSRLYRFQKVVQRHKRGFVAAAVVVGALVLGLGLSLWQAMRATRAEAAQSFLRKQSQESERNARQEQTAADEARQQAEKNGKQLAQALDRVELQRAEDFFNAGDSSKGLAYLARLLRRNPANEAASERLFSALTFRNYAIRLVPPLRHAGGVSAIRHEGRVSTAQFSPDGLRVVTASDDETARVWNALTGQPVTSPLRHARRVWFAEFSPDGRWVVTASDDGTARIWDAQTGRLLAKPLKHRDYVSFARFSPDGRWVVTASDDRTARIWDARTGDPLTAPLRHGNHVQYAEFSPDGRQVVTASDDRTARVWNAETGQPVTDPLKHEGRVWFAQFSPDGLQVVTASGDKTARVWNSQTGQALTGPLQHQGEVLSARFSPDGQRVATASEDRTARLWDAHTGILLTEPMRHEEKVQTAIFSQDGQRIVTASADETARVWDARTGEPLTESLRMEGAVRFAQFSPDGQKVITASDDQTAQIWTLQPSSLLAEPLRHADQVTSACFSPGGERLITGSDDGTARIWDTRTSRQLSPPLKHEGHVTSVRFSPDGTRALTASDDQTARLWDALTGRPLIDPLRHKGTVCSAQFSPDGSSIVTASEDHSARIWDTLTGRLLLGLPDHKGIVFSAEFSPDGRWVVTAAEDNTAQVREVETGESRSPPLKHADNVVCARFSPDGKCVVTGSYDNTARIWDAKSGLPLTSSLKHDGPVVDVRFSLDSTRVLTASWDHTARIWDARTGQPLTDPLKHADRVASAGFSDDGLRVITASYDRTARVWDAQTGQPLSEPLKHLERVNFGLFSPDGQRVVTVSADNTARIWEVPSGLAPVPQWVLELVDEIATQRVNDHGLIERVSFSRMPELKEQLFASTDSSMWTRWGKWFLAAALSRNSSPFSDTPLLEYVEHRVKEGSLASLQEAARLAPTNGLAFARLARAISVQRVDSNSRRIEEAQWLSARALQLAPNHAEAWSIRAEVMQLAGKLSAGLDAIARAINLQPQNPDFWLVQGRLLEEANRMDEAYQSFTRAIHLAGGEPGSQSPPLLDGLYLSRSGFLRRQNRLKEAAVDFCTAKHIAPRDPKVSPEVVDLTCYYNAALNDQWYATQEKNDLTSLPKGMQTLRGVVFDVRALIQVGAESATGEKYPAQVEGIQILRKCRKLHFLHSAINCFGIIEGTQIGSYCIHYANDQHLEIPLLVGKDLADGWSRSDHETAQFIVAWEATTAATRKPDQRARLFKTTWENPSPSLEIKSVDFLSTNAPAAPFLVAITVE